MAKKILIIGGTGFLGKNLTFYFIRLKFNVFVIHKKKIAKKNTIENVKYIKVNTENYNLLKKQIYNIKFDYVVNVSGYVDHSNIHNGGEKIISGYFKSVYNISKLVRHKKLIKFIQIGTSEEYGISKEKNYENINNYPVTPYGLSRLMANKYLLLLNKQESFPVTIFRIFLVYGPHQRNNRLIPYILNNILRDKSVSIYNKNDVRDFLYIGDFLKLINMTLNNKKMNGNIFNIGNGNSISIKDLLKIIINISKSKRKIIFINNSDKNHRKISIPSLKKLSNYSEWKPSIDIYKGLQKTLKFYKKNI